MRPAGSRWPASSPACFLASAPRYGAAAVQGAPLPASDVTVCSALCPQVEGAKAGHQLMNTRALRSLKARLNPNKFPECANYSQATDEYWACQVGRQSHGRAWNGLASQWWSKGTGPGLAGPECFDSDSKKMKADSLI